MLPPKDQNGLSDGHPDLLRELMQTSLRPFLHTSFFLGITLLLLHPRVSEGAKTVPLLIYSDESPREFLGCLNCSEFDTSSLWNEFGSYGSKFSTTSIRNQFSQYGSKFSTLSACNKLASKPPLVVDSDGGYYGRLTRNTTISDTIPDMQPLLHALCQD